MTIPPLTHYVLFEKQDCENTALVRSSWKDRQHHLVIERLGE